MFDEDVVLRLDGSRLHQEDASLFSAVLLSHFSFFSFGSHQTCTQSRIIWLEVKIRLRPWLRLSPGTSQIA
jgi:hypothetical protein